MPPTWLRGGRAVWGRRTCSVCPVWFSYQFKSISWFLSNFPLLVPSDSSPGMTSLCPGKHLTQLVNFLSCLPDYFSTVTHTSLPGGSPVVTSTVQATAIPGPIINLTTEEHGLWTLCAVPKPRRFFFPFFVSSFHSSFKTKSNDTFFTNLFTLPSICKLWFRYVYSVVFVCV